ncbi:hypothetical protein CYCD_17020 [Tenuifilaceae bacterium CYCD]|nr:hypothetical protein CYCD_17020 [Tenuifilaceae bacterium CYCD]
MAGVLSASLQPTLASTIAIIATLIGLNIFLILLGLDYTTDLDAKNKKKFDDDLMEQYKVTISLTGF